MAVSAFLNRLGASCRTAAAVAIVALSGWGSVGKTFADTGTHFIGRFDDTSPQAVRFGWPGSTLAFFFEGTTLAVELSDTGANSFVIEVDRSTSRLDLQPGRHTYVLAKDLAPGPHRVRLIRRTEGFFGPTAYHKVSTNGRFTPAAIQKRRILVIGDSIAAGFGVEGADASCRFSNSSENQYLTYAAIAGRTFDAEVMTIAWSGYGLMRNYGGDERQTMLSILERTIPTETPVDPTGDADADVIIIGLGTNDFHKGAPGPRFESAYSKLLQRLRTQHPRSMIYATIGPLLPAPTLNEAARVISAVVDGRNKAGDMNIAFIRFEPLQAHEYGCDWHPNIAGHDRMADTLAKRLVADLSWEPLVSPLRASSTEH